MKAYKFLAPGAVGPLSGFHWPLPHDGVPGAWVETQGPLESCRSGAHVCRPHELPYWIAEELWEAECEGDTIEGVDCLVVRRARLVRRVAAWQDAGARAFGEACAVHATKEVARVATASDVARGFVSDAFQCVEYGYVAAGAFAAALAVARLHDAATEMGAFRGERAWQATELERTVLGV